MIGDDSTYTYSVDFPYVYGQTMIATLFNLLSASSSLPSIIIIRINDPILRSIKKSIKEFLIWWVLNWFILWINFECWYPLVTHPFHCSDVSLRFIFLINHHLSHHCSQILIFPFYPQTTQNTLSVKIFLFVPSIKYCTSQLRNWTSLCSAHRTQDLSAHEPCCPRG